MRRIVLLIIVASAAFATPAGAVVSGVPTEARAYPFLADLGDCAATLVAPDRAVTAAHCVERVPLAEVPSLRFGNGDRRRVARVAIHPDWARALHENDIALLGLDRPLGTVAPLTIVGPDRRRMIRAGQRVRLLGRGATRPPRAYAARSARLFAGRPDRLRRADLRVLSDATCRRFWRRARQAFNPFTMLCASDPDRRAPYRSACMGDSGGPLLAGRTGAWALAGIVSWGGRCGADRDPSVFTEVHRFAAFVEDPAPVWRAAEAGPPQVLGEARAGAALTCAITWDVEPDEAIYEWWVDDRFDRRAVQRGRAPTWTPSARDAGSRVSCDILGRNAGGVEVTEESAARRISAR